MPNLKLDFRMLLNFAFNNISYCKWVASAPGY